MLQDPQSSAPDTGQGFRTLAHVVLAGAILIFIGLAIVAASVLVGAEGASILSPLTDRSVHYVLIVAIVAFDVYLQRR
jgi:hypothetical protein